MKKLILSAMLTVFAVAVYAGESCESAPCCSKAKAQTTSTSCSSNQKTVAKAKKDSAGKQALKSPKAMSLASR